VPINVRSAFFKNDAHRSGSYRVTFHWDGFLDPYDRGRMSRFLCERRVEVAEPAIDASNGDLVLEVDAPGTVSIEGSRAPGSVEVRVSLTNVSDRAVLVPDSLEDGFGAELKAEWFRSPDGRNLSYLTERERQKLIDAGCEAVYLPSWDWHKKHPVAQVPYRASCSPLGPGERREAVFSLFKLHLPHRFVLECHWDWLPDPDARGSVARFAAKERPVEVTGWRHWREAGW
jgi:hypothetical protein